MVTKLSEMSGKGEMWREKIVNDTLEQLCGDDFAVPSKDRDILRKALEEWINLRLDFEPSLLTEGDMLYQGALGFMDGFTEGRHLKLVA